MLNGPQAVSQITNSFHRCPAHHTGLVIFYWGLIVSRYVIPAYGTDFPKTVKEIVTSVESWLAAGGTQTLDLDLFVDCVHIKTTAHTVAFANDAYCYFFGSNEVLNGANCQRHMDEIAHAVSHKSDELLVHNVQAIEIDHIAIGPDGYSYQVKTHKRWLSPNRRGPAILGISRILQRLDQRPAHTFEQLALMAKKYDAMETEDRLLCNLISAGLSTKDIAERLGCTPRTVENRRNRILEEFGVAKTVDIVKLMVRMADCGFIVSET